MPSNQSEDSEAIKDAVISGGTSIVAAGIGMLIGGPIGALYGAGAGPMLNDLLKRVLSQKQVSRIERTMEYASQQIQAKLNEGASPTGNAKDPRAPELIEGVLLAASNAYEEKKIPLIANLMATAPFTNTPIDNLIQALNLGQQLSYRQLCLIAIIGPHDIGGGFGLSGRPLIEDYQSKSNENTDGLYYDIFWLMNAGVVFQVGGQTNTQDPVLQVGAIVPSRLWLAYPGKLLYHGMHLSTAIPAEDLEPVVEALR